VIEANQNCIVEGLCKGADDVIGRAEIVLMEGHHCLSGDAREGNNLGGVSKLSVIKEKSGDVVQSELGQSIDEQLAVIDFKLLRLNRIDRSSDDEYYPSHNETGDQVSMLYFFLIRC
jgi:hypothetical protein